MSSKQNSGEMPFLRVFVHHEEELRAYARTLLPTWDAVEEAIQEASVVMWQKIDQLRQDEGFLPWAKVILRFEALKVRRKHARDKHVFSEELCEILATEALEDKTTFLEKKNAMASCLAKLDPAVRELVLAPYQAHGSITQIAEASGKSVNSLYKQLGRLRQKLRHCIEKQIAPHLNSGESQCLNQTNPKN